MATFTDTDSEKCTNETETTVRRRSLIKVVGGTLLFSAGIVAGAVSNAMSTRDFSSITTMNGREPQTATDDDDALALKFAPQLQFDKDADKGFGYPMDAQKYLNDGCDKKGSKICQNNVLDVHSNPTYFNVISKTPDGKITINYWFFYGYQSPCFHIGSIFKVGAHNGDWENVQVHIVNNALSSITYWQHDGYYERKASDVGVIGGTHPIVLVGKIAHGSFYNSGGFGNGCGYFWDIRNPGPKLDTQGNLINMAENPHHDEYITKKIDIYGHFPNHWPEDSVPIHGCDGTGCYVNKCRSKWQMLMPHCIKKLFGKKLAETPN